MSRTDGHRPECVEANSEGAPGVCICEQVDDYAAYRAALEKLRERQRGQYLSPRERVAFEAGWEAGTAHARGVRAP